ncbi:hypothetical protein [Paenibacillus graminis]|uniref:hypothetical protein n=1 Tax=Paenibacillus graminis TaxID=189425 RepID=UPI002DBE59C0|nr:hypothetical protein [Paenibacillus graminis]MEC0167416.1 hypothetical protein [Paenibacillus graminis]
MANFKNLLRIQQCLLEKTDEIEELKRKKQTLFNDITVNGKEIISLYFEIEFKKLELMHIKREQITELKKSNDVYNRTIYQQQLNRLQNINEKCISLLVKRLFEEGYGQELRTRGLVPQFNNTELWSTRRFFNIESSIGGNH